MVNQFFIEIISSFTYTFPHHGVLAQLVERNAGSVEVIGSIPLHSTCIFEGK